MLNTGTQRGSPGYVNRPIIFTNIAAALAIFLNATYLILHLIKGNPSLLPVSLANIAALVCLPFAFYFNHKQKNLAAALVVNAMTSVPVFINTYLYFGKLTGLPLFFMIFIIVPLLTISNKRMALSGSLVGINLAFYLLTFRHLPVFDTWAIYNQAELTVMNYSTNILVILLMAVSFYLYQIMLYTNDRNLEQKAEELRQAYDEVNLLASTDPLTGLSNRRMIEQAIMDEIVRAERYHSPLSIILFDLDYFKAVNDTYGHDVGDDVLKTVCSLVQTNMRETDLIGRWGGEEFLIVLPETDLAGAMKTAEKLRGILAAHNHTVAGKLTASFGVAQRQVNTTMTHFFRQVDEAMYTAKTNGRNMVRAAPVNIDIGLNNERLDYKTEWETGIPEIDNEHKNLVNLANQFIEISLSPDRRAEIRTYMKIIHDDLRDHFIHEEDILNNFQYPGLEKHQQIHKRIIRKLDDLINKIDLGEVRPEALYIFLINDMIIGHVSTVDILYIPFIRRKLITGYNIKAAK